ncbi:hypothetical protein BH11ACT3_BH11ACT3_05790 [soil metagenome]
MPGVSVVPEGVDPGLWGGTAVAPLAVGDLWLLSWDGSALGLALVAGVASNYALVWPVSLPAEAAFSPALAVPESPLGAPLSIWPTRETGVGLHLFDRRFGQLLSERTMAITLDAIETGEDAPLTQVSTDLSDEQRELESDAMIDRWETICLHTWPTAEMGSSPLSTQTLEQIGIGITELVNTLNLDTPEAVALYRGELAPSADQVSAIAKEYALDVNDLIEAGGDARILVSPEYKREIVETARFLGLGEGATRDLVRSEVALAARSDGDPASRVAAAIQRLRQTDAT